MEPKTEPQPINQTAIDADGEESSWAPKPTEHKTTAQLLEERYADRHDPDDIDDMVMLGSDPNIAEVGQESVVQSDVLPGESVLEQSGEIQKPADSAGYDIAADDMIQRAESLNETQRFYMSQAFLDALMASVDRGEVSIGGEVVDAKTFKKQLYAMLDQDKRALEEREVKNPVMLIPRIGGMRDAFARLMSEEAKPTKFKDALEAMRFRDENPELAASEQGGANPEEATGSISEVEVTQERVPEVQQESETAKEEVNKLPIEVQRAIKDYELYMSSADRSVRINGYNRDAEEERRRAKEGISSLPTAMKELAARYYEELKES